MKIGIVGCGLVGSTAGYAMVMRGIGREIVFVDKNTERAEAEAADILHATTFSQPLKISAGAYAQLAGSRLVIITAGVNQKPGETRLQLLERNAQVFADIVPQVLEHAPEALLIIATNPVDVMTHLTAQIAAERGVSSSRVIGSGTTLDTARFRALLGAYLDIDPQHVHGYVIGEHGDSEVLAWSTVTVGGLPLREFCAQKSIRLGPDIREQIDQGVRRAAYQIIKGKGATYYGIGSALARIAKVLLHDQRSILTVCTPNDDIAGVRNVTVALPHLIGGSGIMESFPLILNEEEQNLLGKSARLVREAIESLKLD
jgi:L-lactate dehydrogenase